MNPANHPTGIAGAVAAVAVIVAHAFGLKLDAETAAAFVGAIVAVISAVSPRQTTVIHFTPEPTPDNVVPIRPPDKAA